MICKKFPFKGWYARNVPLATLFSSLSSPANDVYVGIAFIGDMHNPFVWHVLFTCNKTNVCGGRGERGGRGICVRVTTGGIQPCDFDVTCAHVTWLIRMRHDSVLCKPYLACCSPFPACCYAFAHYCVLLCFRSLLPAIRHMNFCRQGWRKCAWMYIIVACVGGWVDQWEVEWVGGWVGGWTGGWVQILHAHAWLCMLEYACDVVMRAHACVRSYM